jgi:hypothetical protein
MAGGGGGRVVFIFLGGGHMGIIGGIFLVAGLEGGYKEVFAWRGKWFRA